MGDTHTWCDHPPEGPLSWGKSWDERYFDSEALSENKVAKSEDYMLDTLYTLEVDPKFRFSEVLWPEVVEWCSGCKEHRTVLYKCKDVLAKVQALNAMDVKEVLNETVDTEVDEEFMDCESGSELEEEVQVAKEIKIELVEEENMLVELVDKEEEMVEEVETKEVLVEEVVVKEVVVEEVLVEEVVVEKTIARSNNPHLRQSSLPPLPVPSLSPSTNSSSTNFWRPWERSCEATAGKEWSGEATTLLSVGVTPPALVTPPRVEEVRSSERKVGRRHQRLLTFQATLEKEKGLPPSRWQRRLEFGGEGEATYPSTPVSRRRRGRRRGGLGVAEASSPQLRRQRSRVEEDWCTPSPHLPRHGGLEASRDNSSLLHSSLSPGGWGVGGHRGFCYGCQTWGNMVPIV